MSYLPKEQRRGQIVDAAVELMSRGGLAAATVRAVALAIDASPGQIHHHFASADALRAEAFLEFGRRLLEQLQAQHVGLCAMQRAIAMLDCDPDIVGPNVDRLWKEAVAAAQKDGLIREAVGEVLEVWRTKLERVLKELADQHVARRVNLKGASRRLISLAVGCDLLCEFDANFRLDRNELTQYIAYELGFLEVKSRV